MISRNKLVTISNEKLTIFKDIFTEFDNLQQWDLIQKYWDDMNLVINKFDSEEIKRIISSLCEYLKYTLYNENIDTEEVKHIVKIIENNLYDIFNKKKKLEVKKVYSDLIRHWEKINLKISSKTINTDTYRIIGILNNLFLGASSYVFDVKKIFKSNSILQPIIYTSIICGAAFFFPELEHP